MNHSPIVFDSIRLARKTDPKSSKDAALKSIGFRLTHADRIYTVMLDGEEWTAQEIAAKTGLSVEQVCRRLPELIGQYKVERIIDSFGWHVLRNGFTVWRIKNG